MGRNLGNGWQLISSFRKADLLEHDDFRTSERRRNILADGRTHGNSVHMSGEPGVRKLRFDWREDLSKARDLTNREIEAYGYVLGWLVA